MGAYFYVYENLRIMDLAWDSLWTWFIAAVLTDLGYYWVHRAAHGIFQNFVFTIGKNSNFCVLEINILWAAHQVHHSAEDYNLTTAMRQSMMQAFGNWPFYLPMAFLGVPPTHLIVHNQFNLL